MSDFGFDGMMSMKIAKLIGNTQDGVAGSGAQNKDTLMGRAYKLQKAVDAIQAAQGDSDGSNLPFLIDFLLSDEDERARWAFEQSEIGSALDVIGDFHSQALAACHSVSEIANNTALMTLIKGNAKMVSICAKNATLRGKLVNSLSTEDLLYYGYGYSKYNVGDLIELRHYDHMETFRVVAKDHFTTGKIVLCSEYIEERCKWNNASNSNYSSSYIREYLNINVLEGFSNKIQNIITTSPVPCHNTSTAITCYDKIWLLSTVEVGFGSGVEDAPNEGKAMPWFNSNERRIKKINGGAEEWWLRTPSLIGTYYVWRVRNGGTSDKNLAVAGNIGLVFAFEI